jgi:putative redox protein
MTTLNARLRAGTRVELRTRQFQWLADEPLALGGTDSGPTPYELLLAALAACITTTLRLYADHKGIDLEGVDVSLEFDRVHARDCLECDDPGGGMIDRIQTEVRILGSFTDAERERVTQVVGRCPVHKTLANGVQIFDSVSFDEAV